MSQANVIVSVAAAASGIVVAAEAAVHAADFDMQPLTIETAQPIAASTLDSYYLHLARAASAPNPPAHPHSMRHAASMLRFCVAQASMFPGVFALLPVSDAPLRP
jgi:hypothetical protein